MTELKVGDVVQLKPGTITLPSQDGTDHDTAEIESFLSDVVGGVYLSRRIGGFRYWNILDLELVRPFPVGTGVCRSVR